MLTYLSSVLNIRIDPSPSIIVFRIWKKHIFSPVVATFTGWNKVLFFFQSPSEPPCGVCTWVYSLVLAAWAWQLFKEGAMYTRWAIFNWIDLAWLQTDILEAQTQISCQSETVIEQPGSLSQPCLKARKWGALGVKDLIKGANGLSRLQGEESILHCRPCRVRH